MGLATQEIGYMEEYDYMEDPSYMANVAKGSFGLQFERVIRDTKSYGLQHEKVINLASARALQHEKVIASSKAIGLQYEFTLRTSKTYGLQYQLGIQNGKSYGLQFESTINTSKVFGLQFTASKFRTKILDGSYYETDYMTDFYMAERACLTLPIQWQSEVADSQGFGLQYEIITKGERVVPLQYSFTITTAKAYGVQYDAVSVRAYGLQFTSVLYNITRPRILCDFDSRGTTTTNVTSNSTAVGDFDPNNVNNDLAEKVWRSTSTANVFLDFDTGLSQGSQVDTLGIFNHNLTVGANLFLQESNDSSFTTVGRTTKIPIELENIIWLSPNLPDDKYQYVRLLMQDPQNADGYLQIGIVVFGAARILSTECFTDEVDYGETHYKDIIRTEGQTNVSNDRGVRRDMTLDFNTIGYSSRDFTILKEVFRYARTSLKCLWVGDPKNPTRLGMFAKLSSIPRETQKNMGENADYVSFTVNVDEAE